jgi:hypothetical protein
LLRCMSPVLADCVAKVTEQVLWNWNLKQSNRGAFTFESTAVFAVLLTVSAYAGSGVPPLIGRRHNLPAATKPIVA